MPKPSTRPTLYDDCKTLSITSLKQWGYLKANAHQGGIVSWKTNGYPAGSISIKVFMREHDGLLCLDYLHNKEPIGYNVVIVSRASNLGRGLVWYFKCPETKKLCRKLYLVGKRFLHREAIAGCMYERQTRSKKDRLIFGFFDKEQRLEDAFKRGGDFLNRKPKYAGKYTKHFAKLLKMCRDQRALEEKTLAIMEADVRRW